MTNEEILAKLKEVIGVVKPKLDMSKVGMDSSLIRDLGIDSLSMMLMSLAIENNFGFQFSNDARFDTVGDVVNYIAGAIK